MSITESTEQAKELPEKIEVLIPESELVILSTRKAAEELKKSLRNHDSSSTSIHA